MAVILGVMAASVLVNVVHALVVIRFVVGRVVGPMLLLVDLGRMAAPVMVRTVFDDRAHVRKGDTPFQGLQNKTTLRAIPMGLHTTPPDVDGTGLVIATKARSH
jgi:hypothetical protein